MSFTTLLRSTIPPLRRAFTTSSNLVLSPVLPLPELRETLRPIGGGNIHLDLSYHPGIALIQLDNPPSHNALTPHMMARLADIVDLLAIHTADPSTPTLAAIITGTPHISFCAGLDLGSARQHLLTPTAGESFSVLMQDTLHRFFTLPIITIAAINGAALGGGAELTTACDYRILSRADHARIQFVQAKMGVTPGWGGGGRLVQLIGRSKALRLLGTTEAVTAADGVGWGLVDTIAEEGEDVVEAATTFAKAFFGHVSAVRGAKKVVARASEGGGVEEMMRFEREVFAGLWGGEDNLKAIKRSGKKKPN